MARVENRSHGLLRWLLVIAIWISLISPDSAALSKDTLTIEEDVTLLEIETPDGREGIITKMKVKGNLNRTWEVMTDYNALPDFIPDLKVSKVIENRGNEIILHQEGEAGFLMFRFSVGVTVKLIEYYRQKILFTKIDGDFEFFEGEWYIEPLGSNETLIVFSLAAQPDFYAPKWVIRSMMKRAIPKGMKALRDRIEGNDP